MLIRPATSLIGVSSDEDRQLAAAAAGARGEAVENDLVVGDDTDAPAPILLSDSDAIFAILAPAALNVEILTAPADDWRYDADDRRVAETELVRAIVEGQTKYTDVSGTPALRKAVAEKFRRDSGIDYERERFEEKLNAGTLTLERAKAWLDKVKDFFGP